MGRKNRRRDDGTGLDEARARLGSVRFEAGPDGEWSVRAVTVDNATKTYRCPGCDHEIRPGTAHVVAWPADGRGDSADRRHWHTTCWAARARRRI